MKRYVLLEIDAGDLTIEDVEGGKYALLNRTGWSIFEAVSAILGISPDFKSKIMYSEDDKTIDEVFEKIWEAENEDSSSNEE